MACATLCLNHGNCNGFELLNEKTCNRISFQTFQEMEKDSQSAKPIWFSSLFLQFEKTPPKGKTMQK